MILLLHCTSLIHWHSRGIRRQRQTWALGGVCVEAGDGAGPGQSAQTGLHRLRRQNTLQCKRQRERLSSSGLWVYVYVYLLWLYFALGADLTALGAAAAVTLFHFPEHSSPWRPACSLSALSTAEHTADSEYQHWQTNKKKFQETV